MSYGGGLVVRQELWNWMRRHRVCSESDLLDRINQNVMLQQSISDQFMSGIAVARVLDSIHRIQGNPAIDFRKYKEPHALAHAPVNRMYNWYENSELTHQLCINNSFHFSFIFHGQSGALCPMK